MEQRILNGWKEIGAFLQRGTRTARRWELLFGMPVHRPANRPRTAVMAFPEEVRMWLMRNRAALAQNEPGDTLEKASLASLHETVDRLESQSREIAVTLSTLKQRLKSRTDPPREPPQR